MEIKEFLLPTDTLIKAHGTDKTRLLQELAARAAAALNLDAKLISMELLKRENLGSTGTGGGVAIPHARLLDLKQPLAHWFVSSMPSTLMQLTASRWISSSCFFFRRSPQAMHSMLWQASHAG